MDLRDVICTRRTVHSFESRALPEGAVERALKAAVAAPNHKLTFPWRFCLVGPKNRQKLCELQAQLKAQQKPGELPDEALAKIKEKILSPPLLLVVAYLSDPDPIRDRENYAAVVCGIQNILLSLWNEGIGTKWSTGGLTRHPSTYELCQFNSQREIIAGFIWGGFAKKFPDPVSRPSTHELTRVLP